MLHVALIITLQGLYKNQSRRTWNVSKNEQYCNNNILISIVNTQKLSKYAEHGPENWNTFINLCIFRPLRKCTVADFDKYEIQAFLTKTECSLQ